MHVFRKLALGVAALLLTSSALGIGGAGASSIHIVASGHATGQYAVANAS